MEESLIRIQTEALYTKLFNSGDITAIEAYTLIENFLTYQHNAAIGSAVGVLSDANAPEGLIKRIIKEKLIVGE